MQNVFSASINLLPKHFMKLPLHLWKILLGHKCIDGIHVPLKVLVMYKFLLVARIA